MNTYDIIGLQKSCEENHKFCSKFSPGYALLSLNAKPSLRDGRNMEGILPVIENTLMHFCEKICETFEFGIIIKFSKNLFAVNADVIFCCL